MTTMMEFLDTDSLPLFLYTLRNKVLDAAFLFREVTGNVYPRVDRKSNVVLFFEHLLDH